MLEFTAGLVISLTAATLGFIAFFDFIQLVVKFPRKFVYTVFKYRIPLIIIGLISFAITLYIGLVNPHISNGWTIAYGALFSFLFLNAFVMPGYVIFKSKHKNSLYTSIPEIQHEISEQDMVLVVTIEDESVAFPQLWIERPHIAGLRIGGEDLIMTFCGLSNLGVVYKNDLNGEPMNLKVLAQLEHNLLLFDTKSNVLIEQVYGNVPEMDTVLEQMPAIFMTFGAYKRLYPEGRVFLNPPANTLDEKITRSMLDKLLYAKGGHYDNSIPDLAFPTLEFDDQRIWAKEKVYGVSINGKNVAYTLDFIKANGNVVVEEFDNQTITVKYFPEYNFVNIFEGNVPDVNPYGKDAEGRDIPQIMHANQMLWIVWANFFPGAEVRVVEKEAKASQPTSVAA